MGSKTLKFGGLAIVAMCLTLLAARPAWSQAAARPRPSGGLFGATRSDVGGPGKLNFTFDLAEAVDSGLPLELGALVSGGLAAEGPSTLFGASVDYARDSRRLKLAGTASTAFRYYQRLDSLYALSHSAGFGADLRLPKQGSLRVDQTVGYSPSYLFQLFPLGETPSVGVSVPAESNLGASVPADSAHQIGVTPSYSYRTVMALAFGSPRGTQVTTSGALSRTQFQRQTATRQNLEVREGGAKLDRALSRSNAFSVEYQYRTGDMGFEGVTKEHLVSIGAAYSPALSRTRRATFHFNLTPSWLDLPESLTAGALTRRVRRLGAGAGASYPFRLNWSAAVNYRRGVEYLAVLSEPVYADAASAELTGLIARRVDLTARAGYATAASALSLGSQKLGTYTGDVRIRYALKRSVALYSQYLYYYYDLRGQARLAPDLPSVFEQHAVHIGVMLFIETLGR